MPLPGRDLGRTPFAWPVPTIWVYTLFVCIVYAFWIRDKRAIEKFCRKIRIQGVPVFLQRKASVLKSPEMVESLRPGLFGYVSDYMI